MFIPNFIKIEICLMAKVLLRKTLYKTYGISPTRRRRRKKKNLNKSNSFSASPKRAEKPKNTALYS
jgi:hypothetical protein